MTTPRVPKLHDHDDTDPRTNTVTYFAGGRAFGVPLAEPVTEPERKLRAEIADLKTRLLGLTELCVQAGHDAFDALERERAAIADREIAEARLEIAQGVALRALERMRKRSSTIEAALDRAARTITGRSHAQIKADLNLQMVDPDDDDAEVVDVETKRERPRHPSEDDAADRISRALRAARYDANRNLIVVRQFVALAQLVEDLLTAERRADLAQRIPGGEVPYQLLEAIDDAQRALARAVRR